MTGKDVYSDDFWAARNDKGRCTAQRQDRPRCHKPAITGMTVCRAHGGAAPQVIAKARIRLQNAADHLARELLGMAEGAESEAVKLNAIRDALDRAGLAAKGEVTLEIKPWERLMGDIVGIATISRDQHEAFQRAPIIDAELPPTRRGGAERLRARAYFDDDEVIDAELVEPDAETGPENRPSSSVDALRAPAHADLPGADSASSTAPVALPPVSVSYEDAPAVIRAARVRTGAARTRRRD